MVSECMQIQAPAESFFPNAIFFYRGWGLSVVAGGLSRLYRSRASTQHSETVFDSNTASVRLSPGWR
jgi:hypothetical protein